MALMLRTKWSIIEPKVALYSSEKCARRGFNVPRSMTPNAWRSFIKSRGPAIICLGLSLLTLIGCGLLAAIIRKDVEGHIRRETRNIAQMLISNFDTTVVNLDQLLLQAASIYHSIDRHSPDAPRQMHEALKRQGPYSASGAVVISISDKDGFLIATNSVYPAPVLKAGNFDFHRKNVADDKLYISPPETGRLTSEGVIRASRALYKEDGVFDGIVSISYRISQLIRLVEKLKIVDSGSVALMRHDGITIIRTVGGTISYGNTLTENVNAQDVMPVRRLVLSGIGEGSFIRNSSIDGAKRIGYFVDSAQAPIYAYVAYDYSNVEAAMAKMVLFLTAFWIAISLILSSSLFYFRKVNAVRQQSLVAAHEAVMTERRRVLGDMHDSIGASLSVLISHLSLAKPNLAVIKQRATQILIELRMLADTLGSEQASLKDVLAGVRHRMQSGLELAGTAIVWNVNQDESTARLSAHDALALRLMLMESLSNVINHSRAKTVEVSATYNAPSGVATIKIEDDGCGFNAEEVVGGVGLDNMKKRAKSASVPTEVRINALPGKGTSVRIEIQLPIGA